MSELQPNGLQLAWLKQYEFRTTARRKGDAAISQRGWHILKALRPTMFTGHMELKCSWGMLRDGSALLYEYATAPEHVDLRQYIPADGILEALKYVEAEIYNRREEAGLLNARHNHSNND